MKIISNYKDYYDTAMCPYSYCNESEIIYLRNNLNAIKLSKEELGRITNYNHFNNYLFINNFGSHSWMDIDYICFCNKLYPSFSINNLGEKFTNDGRCKKVEWDLSKIDAGNLKNWYDINELIDYIINSGLSTKKIQFFIKNKQQIIKQVNNIVKNLNKQFNSEIIQLLSIKYKCPYFLINLDNQSIYPNFKSLEQYKFYRVFNANKTYQEIEMYLNSILIINNEPAQITDNKVLIEGKGFDFKTSFRHHQK